jgi:hypothetical protein
MKYHPALRPAWIDYAEIALGIIAYIIVLATVIVGGAYILGFFS